MKRTFIMVLDSFGIGAAGDAHKFGDEGSNTLGHIADACARGEADKGRKGPLHLPNLTKLGLGKAGEESSGNSLRVWIQIQKLSVHMVMRASYPQVKTHRLDTGRLRVFLFCLIGAISKNMKTVSRKNCWIRW